MFVGTDFYICLIDCTSSWF